MLARLLSALGRHELGVLLGFGGLVCGVWLFSVIAGLVMHDNTEAMDRTLLLAFRNPDLTPIGSPAIQDAARDVTALGGIVVLALLTVLTGAFLFLSGKRHMALFVYGSVVSGTLVSLALKSLFQRPRPDFLPHESFVMTASFPSGHSMLSALTYLTLGALLARSQPRKRLKAFFLLVATVLTLATGVSRVYLGVHWPTDVLAGWTAGASWAILCWLVARRLQQRHAIEAEAEQETT
jgi:undecaprenyl-diphosphatase